VLAPPKSFKHADGPATMGRQQGMVQPMPASLCPPAHPTDMAHGGVCVLRWNAKTDLTVVFVLRTDTGQGCGFPTPVTSSGVGDE